MAEETIDVAPSADNGNVSIEETAPVAPSEPTQTDAPADKEETAAPAEPVQELYELPDGRKVDASTLTKEWKENFLPDYTRKSQALAAKEPITKVDKSPLEDPEWQPKTYSEIIQVAKEAALKEIEGKESARIAQQQALETEVSTQLNDVKKLDANVNENALFLHATKYGFRDLRQAYTNMKDMSEVIKKTQKTTADNIAKRVDPVSSSPGATGVKLDPSQFENAVAYMRALSR